MVVHDSDSHYIDVTVEIEIVRYVDMFHKIHYIERKNTWRIYMVRSDTDEETNDLKTRQCMARYVEANVWCIETQRKTKMGYRETKAR